MRALVLLALAALSASAGAQAIVTSPAPERVAVTVYRNGDRGLEPMNLGWLGGYALVSETRRFRLPAGESELRFEGVTSGIVPQSAIVTGLGEAVLEKNRDARLLSPGALLDASLGERVHLRRTSKATGAVREQDAIVRATADGVVLQTEDGIEALRCTGLSETPLAREVPQDLSAKPTLSVRVQSPEPIERTVTLSYISNNFDWQADYIAELSDSGDRISLFGWLTMANGDETSLADAQAQAVAGKLNRERVWVPQGEAKPIAITCWPQGTTSDIPWENSLPPVSAQDIVVTGRRLEAPPPAPPPPPAAKAERGGYDAEEERLGEVRLYRIPVAVTVAAKSQKQVALLRQPAVRVTTVLRYDARLGEFESEPLQRVLITHNRPSEGLGLPLPAGKVALFGRRGAHRILIGEGRIDDHAVGEKVEIPVGSSPGVRASQAIYRAAGKDDEFRLTLTNDFSRPQVAEVRLAGLAKADGANLTSPDGGKLWRVTVPANGTAQLRYSIPTARGR
jgi:hypothetical protein